MEPLDLPSGESKWGLVPLVQFNRSSVNVSFTVIGSAVEVCSRMMFCMDAYGQ